MAYVVVKVGNNVVESVITRNSAEKLRFEEGRCGQDRGQIDRGDDPKGLTKRRGYRRRNISGSAGDLVIGLVAPVILSPVLKNLGAKARCRGF